MRKLMLIYGTLLIAIMLAMMPMPDWTVWLRPAWVLMILIFWAMMTPTLVSVGTAWVTGLIIDLLTGSLLGEHALGFTIIIYFVSNLTIRLRMSPLLQQGITVFLFTMVYLFIIYCIQGFTGQLPGSNLYWLSAMTTMVLWPWLFVVMKDISKWLRVS